MTDPLPPRTALYKRELFDRYVQSVASTATVAFSAWIVASLAGYGHSTHREIARVIAIVALFIVTSVGLGLGSRLSSSRPAASVAIMAGSLIAGVAFTIWVASLTGTPAN